MAIGKFDCLQIKQDFSIFPLNFTILKVLPTQTKLFENVWAPKSTGFDAHLDEILQSLSLDVVELGGEDEAGPRTELSIRLADDVFQYQLLEVNVGLKEIIHWETV